MLDDCFDPVGPGKNLLPIIEIVFDDLRRAFDDRENIVKIMRNARSQGPERGHFLTVGQFTICQLELPRPLRHFFLHFGIAAQ